MKIKTRIDGIESYELSRTGDAENPLFLFFHLCRNKVEKNKSTWSHINELLYTINIIQTV